MRTVYFIIALMSVLWFSCTGDYKPIFNGNDLSGWESFGSGKWYVENGELTGESDPGDSSSYLSTVNYYDNFDLTFEFKEEKMNGDFGVFFHTKVDSLPVYGWKVVIAPLNQGTGSIFEQNGRGWLEHIPEQREKILKPDEWNKMRIKVERGHVTTWLNGYLMVDYLDSKIALGKGGIAFQLGKGGDVKMRLRRIRIKKLDEQEKVNQYI